MSDASQVTTADPDRVGNDGAPVAQARPHPIRGAAQGDSPVPLSVLDLAPVGVNTTPAEALATSTELARLAERFGFHR